MENILPWIFFGMGLYLAISVGPGGFGLFCILMVVSTGLMMLVLKGLWTVVFTRTQDSPEENLDPVNLHADGDGDENGN